MIFYKHLRLLSIAIHCDLVIVCHIHHHLKTEIKSAEYCFVFIYQIGSSVLLLHFKHSTVKSGFLSKRKWVEYKWKVQIPCSNLELKNCTYSLSKKVNGIECYGSWVWVIYSLSKIHCHQNQLAFSAVIFQYSVVTFRHSFLLWFCNTIGGMINSNCSFILLSIPYSRYINEFEI